MCVRRITTIVVAAATLASASTAHCRGPARHQYGAIVDPNMTACRSWNQERMARAFAVERRVKPESRPQLYGFRPKELELLQDALLRKQPRLKSARRARQLIARPRVGDRNGIHGAMAEALFLDKNPEWGYVAKPNASQHDVYRGIAGRRTPVNGQVKFHRTFSASAYANGMRDDDLAHRFFVPDDHVQPLKAWLEARAQAATAAGNDALAKKLWREYDRVRPIGVTSKEVIAAVKKSHKVAAREVAAPYTSAGATGGMLIGSILWEWGRGEARPSTAVYRASRGLSILAVGEGADGVLLMVKDGALRGTIRGNLVLGTAVSLAEAGWLIYEHGGPQAFYQPQFYEEVVGGASAVVFGIAGSAAVTPFLVEVPGGGFVIFGFGMVTGTVGYLGGRSVAHMLIDLVSPEMIQRQERDRVAAITANLDRSIAKLRSWKPAK